MSHQAQLQMAVEWASLQLQTRHFAELIAFAVKLTSVTIKNHNQRAIKHTQTVIHSRQMVCYISAELTSCVFCRRMCLQGKITPQPRVLVSLKLNYIWSYTIAAISGNDPKHILT